MAGSVLFTNIFTDPNKPDTAQSVLCKQKPGQS